MRINWRHNFFLSSIFSNFSSHSVCQLNKLRVFLKHLKRTCTLTLGKDCYVCRERSSTPWYVCMYAWSSVRVHLPYHIEILTSGRETAWTFSPLALTSRTDNGFQCVSAHCHKAFPNRNTQTTETYRQLSVLLCPGFTFGNEVLQQKTANSYAAAKSGEIWVILDHFRSFCCCTFRYFFESSFQSMVKFVDFASFIA